MADCRVPDCTKPSRTRGLCVMHARREERHGSTDVVLQIRGDDLARWWSHVDRRGDTKCWPWLGQVDRDGYGRLGHNGSTSRMAHRAGYELLVGPIGDGLQLDHVYERGCIRRDCVNPTHLEPVTPGENSRRGEPARRDYCPRGHAYTPENTSLNSGTGRTCVTCNRERNRRRRARRAAASVTEAD